MVSQLLRQFRLVERFRLYLTKTWTLKEEAPWRLPSSFQQSVETVASEFSRVLVEKEYGSIRVLVAPHAAATSTLHMSLITIAPGCELSSARATGVEVYQVLSGSGLASQQGIGFQGTAELRPGHLWVVDQGSIRWLSNNGNKTSTKSTSDLVLIRTVDTTSMLTYESPESDVNRIVMDPGRRTQSIVEQISASVRRITRVASDSYKHIMNSNLRGN